jgi:hypothetical protein
MRDCFISDNLNDKVKKAQLLTPHIVHAASTLTSESVFISWYF